MANVTILEISTTITALVSCIAVSHVFVLEPNTGNKSNIVGLNTQLQLAIVARGCYSYSSNQIKCRPACSAAEMFAK